MRLPRLRRRPTPQRGGGGEEEEPPPELFPGGARVPGGARCGAAGGVAAGCWAELPGPVAEEKAGGGRRPRSRP